MATGGGDNLNKEEFNMLKITQVVTTKNVVEQGCGKNWDSDCGIRARSGINA